MSDTTLPIGLPAQRLERVIPDQKPPLSDGAAIAEAHRCLYCYDAPCIKACPTSINIPQFIKRIADGNMTGAAKSILEANILGHSCARVCPVEVLCAGDCVYNEKEEPPIMIGRLQRYATEYAYENNIRFFSKGQATGRKVAMVGGGPASLAAAHELTRLGHDVVVFEGRALPGGLNTTGVAPYKYHAEDALAEVAYVSAIGFEIRTNTEVGRDVTFEELERDYDAIFLGVGLGPDSVVDIPGESLPGSVGAVHLIERLKNEANFNLDGVKQAVVIGGGNTAIDIARELVKVGVPSVTMAYRRDEAAMSGYAHELAYAKLEGVELCFHAMPVAIEGTDHVTGLQCARTALAAPDPSGRQSLVAVAGSEFVLPAQLVVKATGQEKLVSMLKQIDGLTLEKGHIKVDATTHQTGHPKYFAGGDCVNGGKEVVNAAAEGKEAARGIDGYFRALGQSDVYEVTIK